jgi:hypothetical protein
MAHSTVSSTITVTVRLCACTGLLVQHSLTVITINSSITQCTVGAAKLFTKRYQNHKPILHLTHLITTNNNCTTFISTKQHWKVILTGYCLQSTDSQHSHYCSLPINRMTGVHYTNSMTFVSPSCELNPFVLMLHWKLWVDQRFCFN